jgi:ketosteroid isomerase-like protein
MSAWPMNALTSTRNFETVQATYDFVAAGENHVVAYGHFRSRGTGSGAEVESPFGQVWTVRHGQAVRMEWYATGEQARKAAGLTG